MNIRASFAILFIATFGSEACAAFKGGPGPPAHEDETKNVPLSETPAIPPGVRRQERNYAIVQTSPEELDAIIDHMKRDCLSAPPVEQYAIDVIRGMLSRADKEELQRYLGAEHEFHFSDSHCMQFWQGTLEFAFILLSERRCEEQHRLVLDFVPGMLRVLPPDIQKLYLAAGRMVIRMEQYGCVRWVAP